MLYLGRGAGEEGLILSDQAPASEYRIKDTFVEFLRSNFKGGMVEKIQLDPKDRSVIFSFILKKEARKLGLFWGGRKLYFCLLSKNKHGHRRLFKSWTNQYEDQEDFHFEVFNELSRGGFEHDQNKKPREKVLENYFNKLEGQLTQNKGTKKALKKLKVKEKKILGDLANTEIAFELEKKILDLDLEEFSGNSYSYKNLKIKFPFQINSHQKRDLVFDKCKRLKKAAKLLNQRLQDTKEEIKGIENSEQEKPNLDKVKTIFPVWGKVIESKVQETKEDHFWELKNSYFSIAVGKSSKGNDQIRSQWARKEDYWFHLDGLPSSHLILKLSKVTLDFEIMGALGSALRDQGGLDILEIPLIYTQVKNLKGVKGASGKVIYKKEKHIVVPYRLDWKEYLSSYCES